MSIQPVQNQVNDCSICLLPMDQQNPAVETACHHFFHEVCVTPWINAHGTCPMCRTVTHLINLPPRPEDQFAWTSPYRSEWNDQFE